MDGQKINRILRDIYRRLMERYGPQHWWPAREPFEVIVGAILTQSAAWTNTEKAIANLKAAGALSPGALRQLPDEELAGLIYPCGYYNAKARKLKAFADWFGEQYDDNLDRLFDNDTETVRQQLLSVYGVGEETADAILLYAGNKPVFVTDAYTRRVISRAGLAPHRNSYAAYQTLLMGNLQNEVSLFKEFHALLVRLCKETCRTHPLCQHCCLNMRNTVNREPPTTQFPCSAIALLSS